MITVRECKYDEVERFRELEGEYHYMGKSHGAGDMIRLIFEEEGEWIALMTWAAACYALTPWDERIGWNPAMRASRLKLGKTKGFLRRRVAKLGANGVFLDFKCDTPGPRDDRRLVVGGVWYNICWPSERGGQYERSCSDDG